VLGSESAATGA